MNGTLYYAAAAPAVLCIYTGRATMELSVYADSVSFNRRRFSFRSLAASVYMLFVTSDRIYNVFEQFW